MPKRLILVGDATSHGGVVVQGSSAHAMSGRALARLGDAVDCSHTGHGLNRIVEGEAAFLVDGIPAACEGHRTECGCTLIGSVGAFID